MEIRPLDPHDEAEATAWYAALHAGASHGRPAALVVSATALLTSLRTAGTNANTARHPYGAWDGDTCLGTLLVDRPLIDNTHVAEVDVNVPPAHRRRGVGAALYDTAVGVARENGRTLLVGEVHTPSGAALDAHPGTRFALARGFAAVHSEEHRVLDVPLPAEKLAALDSAAPGYETVSWTGVVPEERASDLAVLFSRMSVDAPSGDTAREPEVYDAERVLLSQRRNAEQGYGLVTTVVLDPAGVPVAYTLLLVGSDGRNALQHDTFVLAAHRGRRLGARAKVANLRALAGAHPDTERVHTWTAEVNGPMNAVNAHFGFRAVETLYEMESAL